MGYDLHIHRSEDWLDAKVNPISLDEWLAVARGDDELEALTDNGAGRERSVFGVRSEPGPWLAWDEGEIFSKNPTTPVVIKMVELASSLGACVTGDDGESYDASGNAEPLERLEVPQADLVPIGDRCHRCGRRIRGAGTPLDFFGKDLRAVCSRCWGRADEPLGTRERLLRALRG
jgi:hypothetical protein